MYHHLNAQVKQVEPILVEELEDTFTDDVSRIELGILSRIFEGV